jgi:putative transposase
VIELPQGDDNIAIRWKLIKSNFWRDMGKTERLSDVRKQHGERGIWRWRFWEHLIRDERDLQTHMD